MSQTKVKLGPTETFYPAPPSSFDIATATNPSHFGLTDSDGHGGIDKVASSWTLHGWSPPWTSATITLRGLKYPSMWMYDSTTYQNHAKNLRVYIAFATPNPPFTFICNDLHSADILLELHV